MIYYQFDIWSKTTLQRDLLADQLVSSFFSKKVDLKKAGLLDENDRALLEFVKGKGKAASGEVYSHFKGVSERTIREHLAKLESMGLVESEYVGGGKGRTRVFRAQG